MNPLAPDTLVDGRYRLVRRIGAGGMADVWCADDEMLKRRVALKFLLERYAEDQQFVERFRREAAAAAGLQHPNVVSVYDRGEHEGRPFIVMEYVEGASLKDLITRGLSAGEAIEIVRQVLAGARFAHSRGIIHRDLKPQNVLVDREGRARVADFGIARAGPSEITQTGSVLGTAQYLSPEQAQGLETTAASDLYSIGAVLYEALTGQVPFDASTPVAIALKQVSEQPRPPSEINPTIPPALDAVVLKALAKEPANRYRSADEMLAGLAAVEADPGSAPTDTATFAQTVPAVVSTTAPTQPPVNDPVPPPLVEEEGFWTRNRLIAAGLALLVLIAVVLYLLLSGGDGKQVTVPGVVGKQQDEATAQLEQAGFKVLPTPTPSKAQIGQVLEQFPSGGVQADQGSTVRITYSTGLGKATIPTKLAGLTLAEAEKQLRARGFKSFTIGRRYSSSVDAGRVISTQPAGGALASRSQTVTIAVSRGANLVSVPSVVGQQQADAVAAITQLNLRPRITRENSDVPVGQVVSQTPSGGQQVAPRSTVVITVSKGVGTIVLPNVVGQPKADAIATLKSHGVTGNIVVQKQDTSDQAMAGHVIDEAPPGGSMALPTDQVILTVGHFVAPPPTTSSTTTTTNSTTTTPAKPHFGRRRG